MTIYKPEQRFCHLKNWIKSGKKLRDYCEEAGVSRTSMSAWAINVLGRDYTTTLRSLEQKAVLMKKIEALEGQTSFEAGNKSSSKPLVMVNKCKKAENNTAAPISIEYMGAKISIDEKSIESVFRALKAVNA